LGLVEYRVSGRQRANLGRDNAMLTTLTSIIWTVSLLGLGLVLVRASR